MGKNPAGGRSIEADWPTYVLGQLHCLTQDFDKAIELTLQGLDSLQHLKYEFITSDFRLILCNAYLRKGDSRFQCEICKLQRDLEDPLQNGNPRTSSQLNAAKRLEAQNLYMQHRWPEANRKWKEVLYHLKITEEDIINRKFAKSHEVGEAIFPLAMTDGHLQQTASEGENATRAASFMAVVNDDKLSTFPAEEIEHTAWLHYIKSDHAKLTAKSSSPRRIFKSKLKSSDRSSR